MRAPRARSTLRSKAQVSGLRLFRDSHRRRRGGRGKRRRRVELCVGTGGSARLFKYHLWFALKLLSAVVRHPCPDHSLQWRLVRTAAGKRDPGPFCTCPEIQVACSGGLFLRRCNSPFLEFSVETGFMCFFHYAKK